jgi:hypothetical protein
MSHFGNRVAETGREARDFTAQGGEGRLSASTFGPQLGKNT